MAVIRLHILVTGRVQGVNYRGSTRAAAVKEGVSGWVRNLDDGRVEAMVEGEEIAVNRLVQFMSKGPAGAKVTGLESSRQEPVGRSDNFEITR
jgi:acylphosphatase